MTKSGKLTSTTLKPVPDKWIAADGARVVLSSSPDEIIVLRHDGGAWEVTRHLGVAEAQRLMEAGLRWRGWAYRETGDRLAQFSEGDPPERWQLLYRELLSV